MFKKAHMTTGEVRLESLLRLLFLALAVFDLALGTVFIFFGPRILNALDLAPFADPRFFMICVGLFLYQYTYVQYMVFLDPYRYATCLNLTVVVRLTFPVVYVAGILLWGTPFTVLHWMFAASAAGDVAVSLFVLYAMRRLRIPFFKGDATAVDWSTGPFLLKAILGILAIAEFLIGLGFALVPEISLNLFQLPFTRDPWWTRATGVFLVNIGYIQYLGCRNVFRYSQAVVVSALFRALWPAFYCYWTFSGQAGTFLFKASIMFFAVFDTVACVVIAVMLRRALAERAMVNSAMSGAKQ